LMNDQQRALVEELTGQNEALQKLSAHIHKSFIEAGAGKDPLSPLGPGRKRGRPSWHEGLPP
jgi:hypothetical protein